MPQGTVIGLYLFSLIYKWSKALGKLGNIVAETFCFLSMFLSLPTRGNIVAETKFASRKAKCFPTNSETFLLRKQCFQVCPHVSNSKNISPDQWACATNKATKLGTKSYKHNMRKQGSIMFPQQCFLVCPQRETWGNIDKKQCFRNNVS